jgi:catalase
LASVHNNQRDGYHRMSIDHGRVSYFPNSLQGGTPHPDAEHGYTHYMEKVAGQKVRERSDSFKDFYSQAKLFWNSMSVAEKQHIIEAFHFEVGGVLDKEIKQRVVDMFNNVDGQLAVQIAQGIGANPPGTPGGSPVASSSPAVSQENTPKSARTRKVAILMENGFNYYEVMQVMDSLKQAGLHCEIVSKYQGMLTSVEGPQLEVNKNYASTGSIMYDAVYVTGGRQCVDMLLKQGDALHFVNEAFKHAKAIGATNEGVDLLDASQIKNVPTAGLHSKAQLVNELGVVSIRNAADMGYFSEKFIEAIAQHRHWIRQAQKELVPA